MISKSEARRALFSISRREQVTKAITAVQREAMTGEAVEAPAGVNPARWSAMKKAVELLGPEASRTLLGE